MYLCHGLTLSLQLWELLENVSFSLKQTVIDNNKVHVPNIFIKICGAVNEKNDLKNRLYT